MDSFLVRGGIPLNGKVDISGSKNSALPILAATLLADIGETITVHAVPRLSDIDSMISLLRDLGADVHRHDPRSRTVGDGPDLNGPLDITIRSNKNCQAGYDIVKTMRASICVLGPLLAKRGHAVVSIPGGCNIGSRPIDLHVRGLEKLGAQFHREGGDIVGTVKGRLKGCRMYLGGAHGPTVLGTINIMSAATLAEGDTTLVGAACEPEVSDCAEMLNKMGARIRGHGTPEIRIEGVEKLAAADGADHRVIPDRIECGTFMIAAAITGGRLELKHCNFDHLLAVIDRLEEAGVGFERHNGTIIVHAPKKISPVEMTTQPYPGFPTDLQAQLMALLTLADGMSVITERIYPERFRHIAELGRLGATIHKEGPTAVIAGVKQLAGATVEASDLRASAALVLAACAAQGTTRIDHVHHIDRGYEKIEQKLAGVGARIERIKSEAVAA